MNVIIYPETDGTINMMLRFRGIVVDGDFSCFMSSTLRG